MDCRSDIQRPPSYPHRTSDDVSRLLIRLFGNIGRKLCVKNFKVLGDCGRDLGCMMEVKNSAISMATPVSDLPILAIRTAMCLK